MTPDAALDAVCEWLATHPWKTTGLILAAVYGAFLFERM
jgi:hypothetical protein